MSSKPTGKEIGGIEQFAKLGGTRPAPAPASRQPELVEKTPAEKTHFRQTVYMPTALNRRLKIQAAREGDDISGIVNRLVERYLNDVGG